MREDAAGPDPRATIGMAILVAAIIAALFAPVIAPHDPVGTVDIVAARFHPPFSTDASGRFHMLGTDRLGRDVWSRLAFGARVSLATGLAATLIASTIGTAVGLLAGVWRGQLGLALLGLTDFALALPRVVLLLLLAALWEPGTGLVVVVLGLTGWMSTARLVHGEVVSAMARPYVAAARALGAPRRRIAVRHVLPNVLTPVVVAGALGVGNAIMLEAGLSFLGLGVQPPTPSWGGMIASGRDTIVNAPWVAIAPGLALALVVVACTLVGDSLNDRLAGVSGRK